MGQQPPSAGVTPLHTPASVASGALPRKLALFVSSPSPLTPRLIISVGHGQEREKGQTTSC